MNRESLMKLLDYLRLKLQELSDQLQRKKNDQKPADQDPDKVRKAIFAHAKESIGRKLSPMYKDLGCVEALNNVIKEATGTGVGEGASTIKLYAVLRTGSRYRAVSDPLPGDIIISPTTYGNGSIPGHTGIVSDGDRIMSNNSGTFEWDEHFTMASWRDRYAKRGGFPVFFYRVIM